MAHQHNHLTAVGTDAELYEVTGMQGLYRVDVSRWSVAGGSSRLRGMEGTVAGRREEEADRELA